LIELSGIDGAIGHGGREDIKYRRGRLRDTYAGELSLEYVNTGRIGIAKCVGASASGPRTNQGTQLRGTIIDENTRLWGISFDDDCREILSGPTHK
jgi:hypothetical protein